MAAAGDDPGLELAAILAAVQRALPELGVSVLSERARGWSCAVLGSPEGWALRVPLSDAAFDDEARAQRLLAVLAPRWPVPVPLAVRTLSLGRRTLYVFRWLDGAVRQSLGVGGATELGRVLQRLHDLPSREIVEAVGVSVADWRAGAQLQASLVAERVLSQLSGRAGRSWRAVADAALAIAQDFSGVPALLHGDLELDELLWQDGRLVGITDWDDWTVGDPAWDLRYLWRDLARAERAALLLGHGSDAPFAERVAAYSAATALEDAMHASLDTNPAHWARALRRLETLP